MSQKSQAEDPINSKTTKTILLSLLTLVIGTLVYMSSQKALLKFTHKTKLEEKLSQDKILTFFINGFNDEALNFSVFLFLQPVQKKCGLFFINPIATFDDKTIESMKGDALLYMIPKIESITGLKINFYINLNDQSISDIIDLFDGLPFYLDNYSNISSDKYKRSTGAYIFSGEELLNFNEILVKDDPMSYINRLNHQESISLSLYDRIKEKQDLRKEWFEVIGKKLDTNLNDQDLYQLYNYIKNNNIAFSISEMPGELVVEPNNIKLIIHEENANFGFSKLAAYLSSGDYNIGDLARTEVLNSTDTNGLAKSVKSILNENSIKVLSVGNGWNSRENKSIIIDRSGSTEYSYKIAKLLGINSVYHLINKDFGLDTTVILGEDFEIKPGK